MQSFNGSGFQRLKTVKVNDQNGSIISDFNLSKQDNLNNHSRRSHTRMKMRN